MKLAIVILLFSIQTAGAVTLEAAKGKTSFLAIGRPSAIKINGKGAGPSGDLKFKKAGAEFTLDGKALVDMSSFDTGIGMRDKHMKEKYLEVEKFGQASLSFAAAKIPAAVMENGGTVEVPAQLELHGKTNPVKVNVGITKKGDSLASLCKFKIKLSDYGIAIPSFSGITVADEVEVSTSTEVKNEEVL